MAQRLPEEKVLEQMMQDGTFDELRHMILKDLKDTKLLKEIAAKRVAEELKRGELKDKVAKLKSGGESVASRARLHKEVMEELRKRLEGDLMHEISNSTWKLMESGTDIGDRIDGEVHAVFLSVLQEQEDAAQ
mmetsp:Transcript_44039/g.112459  ORF Transcript_44039/g.112459 Transcript_44039/m.112459 type:complete len:133 (-) Transcript_44039:239-637(-)|eukprot:jgi/Tetstr1/432278/TSEL_002312.t1